MSVIAVCPLSRLATMLEETGASHLVSLLSPDMEFTRPDRILAENHLVLRFNDITEPRENLVLPSATHLEILVQFVDGWDKSSPLVVHCWAGISRSPAAAAIISVYFKPGQDLDQLAKNIRTLSPVATPNSRLIGLADKMFQLDGKLISAFEKIGRGKEAYEGNPFKLQPE